MSLADVLLMAPERGLECFKRNAELGRRVGLLVLALDGLVTALGVFPRIVDGGCFLTDDGTIRFADDVARFVVLSTARALVVTVAQIGTFFGLYCDASAGTGGGSGTQAMTIGGLIVKSLRSTRQIRETSPTQNRRTLVPSATSNERMRFAAAFAACSATASWGQVNTFRFRMWNVDDDDDGVQNCQVRRTVETAVLDQREDVGLEVQGLQVCQRGECVALYGRDLVRRQVPARRNWAYVTPTSNATPVQRGQHGQCIEIS